MWPWLAAIGLAVCSCGGNGSGGGSNGAGVGPAASPPPEAGTSNPPAEAGLPPELRAWARLIAAGRAAQAREELLRHLEQFPDDGRAEFLLGLTFHREKSYALALPHLEKAAGLAPEYHPVHHFLGWCRYYLGDMPGSRSALLEHLRLAPGEGDSHFALGLIDLDENRLDEAEAQFREAIRLQEARPERKREVSKAHARLADVYIRRENLEAARVHLETSTALWPEHYTAFYKLSRVLRRLGRTGEAEAAFQQYVFWQRQIESRRGVPEEGS
jgi:tetratricopeptide (TPR) repeat protein